MEARELRTAFLRFFEERAHTIYESFSLIPKEETLLFTIAGMVPFKEYFLNVKTSPIKRAVSCQRCLRMEDIEKVGKSVRHHTFFEMLGNFSFGDYFKEEAIEYAYTFLVKELGIEKERLTISVYKDDDEAEDIWKKFMPSSSIIRRGEKENFWKMGEEGPCGPCSEIIYDRGEEFSCSPSCKRGCDCDRWIELWNLVFMEYQLKEGRKFPLEAKCIDTGMGLERLCMIMQKKETDYEIDIFSPIVSQIRELTEKDDECSIYTIADHIRAVVFLFYDGIYPENVGRGYVLRRLLRRASSFGKSLLIKGPFLYKIVPAVCAVYGIDGEKRDRIALFVKEEEERFDASLLQARPYFEKILSNAKKEGRVSAHSLFRLHDTYGYPIELAREHFKEEGLFVDEEGFNRLMEEQREASKRGLFLKKTLEEDFFSLSSEFIGYTKLECDAELIGMKEEDEYLLMVFDRTPFFAQEGGQVSDKGRIFAKDFEADVLDVNKVRDAIIHKVIVKKGSAKKGDFMHLIVDKEYRTSLSQHHTATHLLQYALRKVLGSHVKQRGSLVAVDHLRFDFLHPKKISPSQLQRIEEIVNECIWEANPVNIVYKKKDEALSEGAIALDGVHYTEPVRVVEIGSFSKELCGGTHLQNTAAACLFCIIKEKGVAAGIRRIEACCGKSAYKYLKNMEREVDEASSILNVERGLLLKKINELLLQKDLLQKRVDKLQKELIKKRIQELLPFVKETKEGRVCVHYIKDVEEEELSVLTDAFCELHHPCAIALCTDAPKEGLSWVFKVTKDFSSIDASDVLRAFCKEFEGGAGGSCFFAKGYTKRKEGWEKFLSHLISFLNKR